MQIARRRFRPLFAAPIVASLLVWGMDGGSARAVTQCPQGMTPVSGLQSVCEITFTSQGDQTLRSWTVPSGVTSIDVLLVGGGGAGGNGGGEAGRGGGGGGGGGEVVEIKGLSVTAGALIQYLAGPGGRGGIHQEPGTLSRFFAPVAPFAAIEWQARGGINGLGTTSSTGGEAGAGGTGGSGGIGTVDATRHAGGAGGAGGNGGGDSTGQTGSGEVGAAGSTGATLTSSLFSDLGQIVGSGINAGLGAFQTALKNNRIRDQKNIQVVGGALVDYTDPNNPKILYETPSKTNKKIEFNKETGQVIDYSDPLKPKVTNVEGYKVPKQKPNTKPLSGTLQKAEEDDIEAVMSMQNINTDANKFYNFIQDGELEFGLFDNIDDAWKGWWGKQGREEELSSEFKIFIQKLANDSLKLAKGVQTEGDAERVGKELLSAYDQNNSRLIKNRLLKMQEINQRTINIRKALLKNRRISQGAKPFDFGIFNEADIEFEVVKE